MALYSSTGWWGFPLNPSVSFPVKSERLCGQTQREQESFSSGLLAGAGQVVTVDNINPALP